MDSRDELISTLPVHYSNALAPGLQLHQFPLLNRPLHVPPSAVASGKRITSRMKMNVRRLEIHVPADTRPEVWNQERGTALGQARVVDDKEKNQQGRLNDGTEPRLGDIRLQSDIVSPKGAYMLGIVRDGEFKIVTCVMDIAHFTMLSCSGHLHLHPIQETHQLRPTLTYLDVHGRKNKRGGVGSDSDSDDGPPPDPDEAAPLPVPKKEKKSTGETKEVNVAARRADDRSAQNQGGLSAARRDILRTIRLEEDDQWQDLSFHDTSVSVDYTSRTSLLVELCSKTEQSEAAFEQIFSTSGKELILKTDITTFLKDIPGL